jgi:hypothetical protein
MRVITAIGEQGLEHPDGLAALLRPSFYAMTQLGDPSRIVEVFADLHRRPGLIESMPFDTEGAKAQAERVNAQILRRHWRDMLFLSWEVMNACSEDDLAPFIGEPGSRYGSYRLGPVSPEVMLALSQSLMQHGVIGPMPKEMADPEAVKEAKQKAGNYTPEFDAMSFVSKAIAHLGLSEAEAWNLTLTGFAAHWEAKFGEPKEKRHSSEHDATMNWLEKVNALRDKRK